MLPSHVGLLWSRKRDILTFWSKSQKTGSSSSILVTHICFFSRCVYTPTSILIMIGFFEASRLFFCAYKKHILVLKRHEYTVRGTPGKPACCGKHLFHVSEWSMCPAGFDHVWYISLRYQNPENHKHLGVNFLIHIYYLSPSKLVFSVSS